VLEHYGKMEPELRPRAIELLTQRAVWGRELLQKVAAKEIAPSALNVNQVKKLLAFKDAELSKQVTAVWGSVREERNPKREAVVADMRSFLKKTPGDAVKGQAVFKTLCAQCHKIHGEGQDVGPDITSNGRSDFEQLLSNVFDPSLVIGAAYQATTVSTKKGQVFTGIVVEDNAQRVVLKTQGAKTETIPRDMIDEMVVSKVSLMPEDIEKQLKPQEIADLFAFLCLDRPPSDPTAKRIPGAPNFGK
jgi:putative heme-binding domain-containing protein